MQLATTKLDRLHSLSSDDRAALEKLPLRTVTLASEENIVWPGQPADHCAVILEGMAFSYKLTSVGERQIVALHLAGDMPDLQSLRSRYTDTGVAAIYGCRVGYVPYDTLGELCASRPSLANALWRETLLQAAIMREWLLNIGRREALVGVAHLLCEVVTRHRIAGLTMSNDCRFPFTQIMMGDALGLSTVHVNRVVKKLRQDGLIEWEGRHLTVVDWDRLRALADFDPAYLYLDRIPDLS